MRISLTKDGGLFGYYQGEWYPVNEDRVLHTLTHKVEFDSEITLRSVFLSMGKYPLLKQVSLLPEDIIDDMIHLPHWTRSERQPLKVLALHRQLIAKASAFSPIIEDEPQKGFMRRRVVAIRRESKADISQHVSMSGHHHFPGTRYSLQGVPANTVIEAPLIIDRAALILSDDSQVEERHYDDVMTVSDVIEAVSRGVSVMSMENRRQIRIISDD